jgi:formyl-CoA transferase
LTRLRVLDIGTLYAGPGVAMFLGDFGADVIKVEHPRGDEVRRWGYSKNGVPLWWKMLSRNKRAITLNLSVPAGQELLRRLVRSTDILVENFRPGTLERWGLGYSELAAVNPRLIMLRVSGFGQEGPYARHPFFGTLGEAMSGFAQMTGCPEGPPTLPPFGLADGISALAGAFVALAAAYHRDACHGEGQSIDLAIYEPIFTVLGSQPLDYDQLGVVPHGVGNRLAGAAPRNVYRTKDGQWVALSASSQRMAERVFSAIGRGDLLTDARYRDNASRLRHVDDLDAIIGQWIAARDFEEVLRRFEEAGAPLAPIFAIHQIFTDPHVQARGTLVALEDPDLGPIRMQNVIAKLSRTPTGSGGRARAWGNITPQYTSRNSG